MRWQRDRNTLITFAVYLKPVGHLACGFLFWRAFLRFQCGGDFILTKTGELESGNLPKYCHMLELC